MNINVTAKELGFPLVIQIVGNFEKSNSGVAVNVLFNSKEGMHKARKSKLYGKCN